MLFFLIQKRKQVQNTIRQQQLKFDYESSLLTTKIEVQEQAFQTVSGDIHDNIAQVLSFGCMQLANVKNSVADEKLLQKLDDNLQLFRKSVKDLRLLSHSLNTGLIEHRTLEHSVKAEFDRIEAFSSIKCYLDAIQEDDLDAGQRLLIFRIIQEGLQNVLKHAKATEIHISLESHDDRFCVKLRDNGVGFDRQQLQQFDSLGFLSMQQRATQLGAELSVDSLQGSGTTLTLELPVNKQK